MIGIKNPGHRRNSLAATWRLKRPSADPRSVVAISPAGLWRVHGAPHVKYARRSALMTRHFPDLQELPHGLSCANWHLQSISVEADVCRGAMRLIADDSADHRHPNQLRQHCAPGGRITIPVTVASQPRLILPSAHSAGRSPAHTRWSNGEASSCADVGDPASLATYPEGPIQARPRGTAVSLLIVNAASSGLHFPRHKRS